MIGHVCQTSYRLFHISFYFSLKIEGWFCHNILVHGNKARLKGRSLALLRCKPNFLIFELGLNAVQIEFSDFRAWPYCGANQIFRLSSLALFRWKSNFLIFELGLISVKIELFNIWAWPYYGANRIFKFSSFALLRCKSNFLIFELGLISVKIELFNFWAWPYYGANRTF